MADDSLLFISIGSVFCLISLVFCCYSLQIRSQLSMYQNLFQQQQAQLVPYTILPSAPPSVDIDPV